MFGFNKKSLTKREAIEEMFDRKVLTFPGTNVLMVIADFLTGVQIFGGTGSGKTSGPGNFLAKALLKMQFGFLVMCAKTTETALWKRLVKAMGREDDMVIFGEGSNLSMNFLEYEMHRNGRYSGDTNALVDLLMKIYEVGKNFAAAGSSGGDDRFWDNGMRRLIAKTIDLLRLAEQEISFINIRRIIIDMLMRHEVEEYKKMFNVFLDESLPKEQREAAFAAYQEWKNENYFLACFSVANQREDLNEEDTDLFNGIEEYFLKVTPRLPDDTRSTFVESVLGLIEPFTGKGILKKHFTKGVSKELLPAKIFEEEKILILDFSVKKHGVSGVYAQAIMKLLWQMEMERRDMETEENPLPAVLWCDECHLFVNPEYDAAFQSTSRSSGAICIYLTQNLNGYYTAMGNKNARSRTKNLLGNLACSIFCSNSDFDTNEYAAKMIGRTFRDMGSVSSDHQGRTSSSVRKEYHYQIPPEAFTTLKNGRKKNGFKVETIIFKTACEWSSGGKKPVNYGHVFFDQKH